MGAGKVALYTESILSFEEVGIAEHDFETESAEREVEIESEIEAEDTEAEREADKACGNGGGGGDFLGARFGEGVFSPLTKESEAREDRTLDDKPSFSIVPSPTTPFALASKLSNRLHSCQISGVTPCMDSSNSHCFSISACSRRIKSISLIECSTWSISLFNSFTRS